MLIASDLRRKVYCVFEHFAEPIKVIYYFCAPVKQNGAVAQSVERRTENPCVTGSIPVSTTTKIKQLS